MSLLALALPQPRGLELASRNGLDRKYAFTPADPTADWQRIQHLVLTANTTSGQVFGDGNSAAFACLMQLALGSIEPPLGLWKLLGPNPNKRDPIDRHPFLDLLQKPNTFHRLRELLFWKTWCQHVDGNAYWLKERSGNATRGNVLNWWPVSPKVIEPYTEQGSKNYIDGYRRQVRPGEFVLEPVENVIHFRLGIDDRDHRKGLAPVQRLMRQISSDEAATRWTDRMLEVGGAASMMVTVPKDSTLTADQADELRLKLEERFTHDRVGSIGVLGGGATAERYGFSPQEMDLAALHNVPETRICAVIGVHPAIALLGIGLTQTANFASLREVYEAFTERKLAPLWTADEETLTASALVDFNSDPKVRVGYDLSEVKALQEDQNQRHQRVREDFKAGLITREMALRELGYDPDLADDEILVVPSNTTYVRVADAVSEPQAEPPAVPPGQAQPAALPPGQQERQPPAARAAAAELLGYGTKASDLDLLAERLQALVELAWPPLAQDLETYQDELRRSTKRAVVRQGV